MRVVLATQAATGHVYPLMPWARALVDAGHHVVLAAGAGVVPWLEGLGFEARPVGQSISWALGQVQQRSPELTTSLPAPEAWRLDLALFADALPRGVWPAMVDAFEELRPDIVMYEASNLGALLAAGQLGLPAACVGLWAVGRWHVDEATLARRVLDLWSEHRSGPFPLHPVYGTCHLDPSPPGLRPDPPAAPGPHGWLPTRHVPWGDPRDALLPWVLDRGSRPLVYLTLGTVGWGSADIVRSAVRGLAQLPVDVLVALGAHFDPADLGDLPGSVRVERFVRQDLVLPHLAAAVHHAGSGTMLGACAHGLPQLLIPLGADQFQNADALVRAGAGLALPRADVEEDAVRRTAEALLEDPRFGVAARRIGDQIASMPSPADRLPHVEGLAGAR